MFLLRLSPQYGPVRIFSIGAQSWCGGPVTNTRHQHMVTMQICARVHDSGYESCAWLVSLKSEMYSRKTKSNFVHAETHNATYDIIWFIASLECDVSWVGTEHNTGYANDENFVAQVRNYLVCFLTYCSRIFLTLLLLINIINRLLQQRL